MNRPPQIQSRHLSLSFHLVHEMAKSEAELRGAVQAYWASIRLAYPIGLKVETFSGFYCIEGRVVGHSAPGYIVRIQDSRTGKVRSISALGGKILPC